MKEFMGEDFLLPNEAAKKLYHEFAENMPIVDYHCHISPAEIAENRVFENITQAWLGGDHYKWRLMRTAGIDERYITGNTDWREKFIKYAAALELAAGNPLYHWSHMELSMFFDIDKPLKSDNAAEIYDEANAFIAENRLSPRKLIEQSKVETLCTTDDIIDTLEYHKKIKEDKHERKNHKGRVPPNKANEPGRNGTIYKSMPSDGARRKRTN